MSGEHFPTGQMPHEPQHRLPEAEYEQAQRDLVLSCTDVVLINGETGDIFLGDRQTEPQLGPWLIGGRDRYGASIGEDANKHVKGDFGMDLNPFRFEQVASYSTPFPVAGPEEGSDEYGRHTVNEVMAATLKPAEVSQLNDHLATGKVRDEYSGGRWYTRAEIAESGSDFPDVIKQLVRDLYVHDLIKAAMQEDAILENAARDKMTGPSPEKIKEQERSAQLSQAFGLSPEDALKIARVGGPKAFTSIVWAHEATKQYHGTASELQAKLHAMLANENFGDFHLRRQLQELGVNKPDVRSDNGPALRAVLNSAVLALNYDQEHDGILFDKVEELLAV